MVKLFNLLDSPLHELRLNDSRCILALTDQDLGMSAVNDDSALRTLISSLEIVQDETLENTLWIIANAAGHGLFTLFSVYIYSLSPFICSIFLIIISYIQL